MARTSRAISEDEQWQFLQAVAHGATNRTIAERHDIAEKTVSRNLVKLCETLGMRTLPGAVKKGIEMGKIQGAEEPELADPRRPFHPSEEEVVTLLLQDIPIEEIASRLDITAHNVTVRIARAGEKFGFKVRSKEHLVALLVKNPTQS